MENVKEERVDVGYVIPTYSNWTPMAKEYHPLQAGSIDGTDAVPHDRAVIRAMQVKYRPNKGVIGNPRKTLFIGRLTRDTREDIIRRRFEEFGKLENCRLVRDIVTGLSRGYAFVEYENEWDARSAWKNMHKAKLNGAVILVEYEAERNLKGWIPRRLGGGWGGKKESGQLRFGGRDRQFRRPLPVNSQEQSQRWGGSRDHKRDVRRDSSYDRSKHVGDWGRESNRRDQRDRNAQDRERHRFGR